MYEKLKFFIEIFIILIILIFWWLLPLIKNNTNKTNFHISINILISWGVFLAFLVLSGIWYLKWSNTLIWFWLLSGWFFSTLFSFLHCLHYKKEIKNETFKKIVYYNFPVIIVLFIWLILVFKWYFK